MKVRAFTLVETLSVIAIIAVVTAILTPVFAMAKRQAQVTSSTEVLRQLHLSTVLYRMEYDGDGVYGEIPEMGLPIPSGIEHVSPSGSAELKSPCGKNLSWIDQPLLFYYIFRPWDTNRGGLAPTSQLYQDNLLLFYDLHCDDPGVPVANPEFTHFGIGVLLSGQVVRHRKPGPIFFKDEWWTSPPRE